MKFFDVPSRGAVLAETLIAIALLAVASTSLLRLSVTGAQQSLNARQRSTAALLAQEKMEEIIRARDDLATWEEDAAARYPSDEHNRLRFSPTDDNRQQAFDNFRWSWEITSSSQHLQEVSVRVNWHPVGRRDGEMSHFELSTLLFSPAEAGSGGNP